MKDMQSKKRVGRKNSFLGCRKTVLFKNPYKTFREIRTSKLNLR